ncbi:DUF86 domain-containing protein [Methanocorpusculum sp. MG]|uniref:DUF86 domain-containing protein n=1 Tax=Methanocorpusculum petauri TaxID=3002863 RepID=A0ABT4IEL7_9EURY|nr:DUF86 domain-containing protein [Methanocorpusculum petauri]MCZ0860180.1 DUF86 domain-containing protein [Methanocorpusculum petauri]MDE2443965.1 DUF86 domain-containing protein [Methanocorpusculum sp.]
MSPRKEVQVYLFDILFQIEVIESELPAISHEEFMKRALYQNAMIRSIEVIGEAVKNIPDTYKAEHPEIPWKEMAGTRDKLIHGYAAIDLMQIWNILQYDIPPLKRGIVKLLSA